MARPFCFPPDDLRLKTGPSLRPNLGAANQRTNEPHSAFSAPLRSFPGQQRDYYDRFNIEAFPGNLRLSLAIGQFRFPSAAPRDTCFSPAPRLPRWKLKVGGCYLLIMIQMLDQPGVRKDVEGEPIFCPHYCPLFVARFDLRIELWWEKLTFLVALWTKWW